MENRERGVYAMQFHPEVQHTPKGRTLLTNFLRRTGIALDWTPEHILEEMTVEVKKRVGDERVMLAISGGVDSSTLGLLLNRALGSQLQAVFVDHGLLRAGEAEEVERALNGVGMNLSVVDATERFAEALIGIEDPEAKRRAIGREFIEVFNAEVEAKQAVH